MLLKCINIEETHYDVVQYQICKSTQFCMQLARPTQLKHLQSVLRIATKVFKSNLPHKKPIMSVAHSTHILTLTSECLSAVHEVRVSLQQLHA